MVHTSSQPATSLAQLRRVFATQGLTRRPTARILVELAVHVTCMVGGAALFLLVPNFFARVAGLLISACGCVAIASNSHTSSHYGTSRNRSLNETLTYFG